MYLTDSKVEEPSRIESYSDGSGQGPSGVGSISFIIVKDKCIIHQDSKVLMDTTNNEAEYAALGEAVMWLHRQGYKGFTCYVDSELVYKQIKGEYATNKPNLVLSKACITRLLGDANGRVEWVPRTNQYIQVADRLNRATVRKATQ